MRDPTLLKLRRCMPSGVRHGAFRTTHADVRQGLVGALMLAQSVLTMDLQRFEALLPPNPDDIHHSLKLTGYDRHLCTGALHLISRAMLFCSRAKGIRRHARPTHVIAYAWLS